MHLLTYKLALACSPSCITPDENHLQNLTVALCALFVVAVIAGLIAGRQ